MICRMLVPAAGLFLSTCTTFPETPPHRWNIVWQKPKLHRFSPLGETKRFDISINPQKVTSELDIPKFKILECLGNRVFSPAGRLRWKRKGGQTATTGLGDLRRKRLSAGHGSTFFRQEARVASEYFAQLPRRKVGHGGTDCVADAAA